MRTLAIYRQRLSGRRGGTEWNVIDEIDPAATDIPPRATGEIELDAEALHGHFRNRIAPGFFSAIEDRDRMAALLDHVDPGIRERNLSRAERIVGSRFDLLGLGDLDFGDPIDWHLDPTTGVRAPRIHWSRIDTLDPGRTGDCRVIWELNRHQHLVDVGKAYWYTGNERYARVFVDHIDSWISQNPAEIGINWANSMEVALRAMSWLWSWHFFRLSDLVTSRFTMRLLRSLTDHGRHIESFLSTFARPGAELLGEALGLLYLGLLLPEIKRASRWRRRGFELLRTGLENQVLADGGHCERSTCYHRYATDIFIHAYILAIRHDFYLFAGTMEDALPGLIDYSLALTRPDGRVPMVGDGDGGRLLFLERDDHQDFGAVFSTGAVLFRRGDYKAAAGRLREETLWLLGPEAYDRFEAVDSSGPSAASAAFELSGYYVMRDGRSRSSSFLLMDCGSLGREDGHAHADAGSLEVVVRGTPCLIDPGTYTYTGSPYFRDYFRTTSAHNTLVLDNMPQAAHAGVFKWGGEMSAVAEKWISTERFDYFAGCHNGYARSEAPVSVRRIVFYLKGALWIVVDELDGIGEHDCEAFFHFPPGQVDCDGRLFRTANGSDGNLAVIPLFDEGQRIEIAEGWVSPDYLAKERAFVGRAQCRVKAPDALVTFLVPVEGEASLPEVREIDKQGGDWAGRLLSIEGPGFRDRVGVKRITMENQLVGPLTTDFRFAWVRLDGEGRDFKTAILVDGRTIDWEEGRILSTKGRSACVILNRSSGKITAEVVGSGGVMIRPGNETIEVLSDDLAFDREEKGYRLYTRT
ncbi:alginate lyase family protein [Thermodesulfobacteriota bacterium]